MAPACRAGNGNALLLLGPAPREKCGAFFAATLVLETTAPRPKARRYA